MPRSIVRRVGMTERSHQNMICVFRIHHYPANLASVFEPNIFPCIATIIDL